MPYPWNHGDTLNAVDLNAAIAPAADSLAIALAAQTAAEGALPIAGGRLSGSLGLGTTWTIGATDSNTKFRITAGTTFGTNDRAVCDATGAWGFGTANPTARLHIISLGSVQTGLQVSQTGPTTGSFAPFAFNDIAANFSAGCSGGVGTGVSAFHAALGVGGPNLVGNEFYGGSFAVSQTSADTAAGDKVGVSAGVNIPFSSPGKIYGASFSHTVSGTGAPAVAVGVEVDSTINGTGTANERVGFHALNLGINQATSFDSAFAVGCSGAVGADAGAWQNLISLYTSANGVPGARPNAISTTGNFFFADFSATVANIFNLPNVTVTGDILSFPNVVMTGSGLLGLGVTPTSRLDIGASLSATSWTTSGIALRGRAGQFTDTTGSGTIANRVAYSFGVPTFASTSSVTLTAASTVYIAGPPAAGANTTISQAAALVSAGGNWGINSVAPVGQLTLAQGGNTWSDGIVLTRAGTVTASIFLDATDGSFNIGRTNASTKYFSMDATGLVNLTKAFTVATLPAASAANKGARAYVTDAVVPTFLGALTGGGSVVCPVFSNGTAWVSA